MECRALNRRRFLRSMLACAGSLPWLAGCVPSFEPLRFGSNPWPGYASLRVAEANGLLAPSQFRVLDFPSSSMVLSAFRNGMIDAAGLTLDEVLMLAAEGQAVRIILVFDFSSGADVIVARPGIDSVAQLKGARVGVETEALGAYMVGRALASAGLPPGSVQIVSVPADRHEFAFNSGSVDALVTFDPVRSALLARGANVIFSSRAIPGEIVDVLAVHEHLLRERSEDLRALLKAHFAGRAYMQQEPSGVVNALGARLGLTDSAFREALTLMVQPDVQGNLRLLRQGEGSLQATGERMASVMRSLGLIDTEPRLEALVVSDLIEEE